MKERLIAIVGPTAAGKSALALALARRWAGEIVNADSRQVYRLMDIGTAKPSAAERAEIPHHLYDVVDPDGEFNLALYQRLARAAIAEIHVRCHLPLLVGGSGQYMWALIEGWSIPGVPPDPRIRAELESRAAAEGPEGLYAELRRLDPQGAAQIDPRNVRRIVRALEVCRLSSRPFSEMKAKAPPLFDTLIIGIAMERQTLYRCIDERVDRMIAEGFIAEVRALLERGYSLDLPAMSSLGYREIGEYLMGKITLDEAVKRIKFETHRLARYQNTWFRPGDKRIHWLRAEQGLHEAAQELIEQWMAQKAD